MAKSEVLVRMKADTQGYDANIAKARRQLDQFKKDNLSAGGAIKQLSSTIVSSAAKFASFGAAASAAAKLAKDAFFQLESNIDEWGRTVKAAEGAYDIFLQTLNNGNWSNFFSNLSQAITGARDLYDAFDRLGSIKANNAVAIAMTQSEIQNLRLLKQQGQNVDDKIKEATARLKALQSQSASAGINAGRGSVVNTLRNGVNSIGGASINDATLKRVADNIANQGQAYFDFMKRRADYLGKKGMVTHSETIYDSQGGTYERQYRKFDINALSKEEQRQYAIAKTVTERETEIQKGLTVWSQAVNEKASNAREIFRDNRYAMQGSGGGKTGGGKNDYAYASDSIMAQEKEVQRLTQLWKTAGEAVRDDYKVQLDEAKKKLEGMTNPMGPQMKLLQGDIDYIAGGPGKTPTFANGIPQIGEGLKNVPQLLSPLQQINAEIEHTQQLMEMSPTTDFYQQMKQRLIELQQQQREFTGETTNDGKNISKSWNSAASAISGVGRAITTIEDPSAKIIGMIAEAVATIALGFSQAIGKDVGEKGNVWYGIAAAAAGVASMISTISAIHSATGYAQGGIVDGRSYSGDNIPILANAGEVVLTRAMQNNLATQLQGGGFGNMNLTATISGEQIRLALNTNGRRTGRGEYVTTNFR